MKVQLLHLDKKQDILITLLHLNVYNSDSESAEIFTAAYFKKKNNETI